MGFRRLEEARENKSGLCKQSGSPWKVARGERCILKRGVFGDGKGGRSGDKKEAIATVGSCHFFLPSMFVGESKNQNRKAKDD